MDNITIRTATPEDAEQLLEIYRYYVLHTAISFEYEVPTKEEFFGRMNKIQAKYPYLVAVQENIVLGYAHAREFVSRAAYDWSVETTIYLAPDARKRGIGRKLYEALEQALKEMGVLNLYACIGYPEAEDEYLTRNSAEFHAHLGFQKVGVFHKCGYKFHRWYNMIWMEKIIGEHQGEQAEIKHFPDVVLGKYRIAMAKADDSDEILNLYKTHLGGPADWNEYYPNEETIEFDLSRDSLFVMKNEADEIIAAISIDSDKEVDALECWNKSLTPAGEISRVCVRKDMQNRGIARTMMQYVFEIMKEHGMKMVHILVRTGHAAALRSYSHLGFVQVGECELFDKQFVCMEKAL